MNVFWIVTAAVLAFVSGWAGATYWMQVTAAELLATLAWKHHIEIDPSTLGDSVKAYRKASRR